MNGMPLLARLRACGSRPGSRRFRCTEGETEGKEEEEGGRGAERITGQYHRPMRNAHPASRTARPIRGALRQVTRPGNTMAPVTMAPVTGRGAHRAGDGFDRARLRAGRPPAPAARPARKRASRHARRHGPMDARPTDRPPGPPEPSLRGTVWQCAALCGSLPPGRHGRISRPCAATAPAGRWPRR